ncbi:hypothetical protein JHFBIEKO_2255 [Methylobacterium mesophilicum]|nr:hypothetical protein JHFBIEKO_2255 [Methylobacterium mesophilicum]
MHRDLHFIGYCEWDGALETIQAFLRWFLDVEEESRAGLDRGLMPGRIRCHGGVSQKASPAVSACLVRKSETSRTRGRSRVSSWAMSQ